VIGGVFWDYVETSSVAQMSMDSEMYNDWCILLHGVHNDCRIYQVYNYQVYSIFRKLYNDWCLPHIYDDCSPTSNPRASNLLFGCVSAATVLKNAFVLVQVNRFQQIIGVYTLQAPSYGNKVSTKM